MKKLVSVIILVMLVIAGAFFVHFNKASKIISAEDQKEMLALMIQIKPDGVYYRNDLIIGADPKTMEYLGHGYMKDSKRVYVAPMGGMVIEGADPKTFVPLSDMYTKDMNNVYLFNTVMKGVDPKTFELVGGSYVKDAKNVYDLNGIITGADSRTAVLVWANPGTSQNEYLKDKDSVYCDHRKIQNADPVTFVYVGNGYSKDKNAIYYDGGEGAGFSPFFASPALQGADLKTFEVINSQYAKDKSRVYSYGIPNSAKPEDCTVNNLKGCENKTL